MVLTLERLGIPCEFHHHEVASGGQCEIDLRFERLTRMADQVMTYKYVVKNVARAHGKSVTFMPKPIFGDNGSGMHCHQSLWKEGTPLMADKSGYAGLSQLARAYVGGLLEHAPALLAFCAPTTNSYRRLVPGLRGAGEPRLLAAQPLGLHPDPDVLRLAEGEADRVSLPGRGREPVPRLLGDADGRHRRDRARARSGRAGRLRPLRGAARDVPQVPGSLAEALDALEADHEFLLRGGVFTEDLIRTWIDWKREHEVDVVRLRPHPAEFGLYYDC